MKLKIKTIKSKENLTFFMDSYTTTLRNVPQQEQYYFVLRGWNNA